jgi:hypothetical protein
MVVVAAGCGGGGVLDKALLPITRRTTSPQARKRHVKD